VTEYVKEIRVFQIQIGATGISVGSLCWEIIGYAAADGLEVVAGRVPNGFTQVYPAPYEVFRPMPGKTYGISVVTDVPPAKALGTETAWVGK